MPNGNGRIPLLHEASLQPLAAQLRPHFHNVHDALVPFPRHLHDLQEEAHIQL